MTVEGNYNRWHNSKVSKRAVAEEVIAYLVANGAETRMWKGVEQQITTLERKFREALGWRDQTGQGILDEADKRARQAEAEPDDSDAEDYVATAATLTEAEIRKKCKYFYELEPVMLDRPSSIPLDMHEQDVGANEDLALALNLVPTQDRPSTPSQWSNSNRGENNDENASPVVTLGNPSPGFGTNPLAPAPSPGTPITMTTVSGWPSARAEVVAIASQRLDTHPQRRPNYAKRITERLFPSREEMAAQSAAEMDLNRDRLETDARMVDANVQLARALCQEIEPSENPQEQTELRMKQMHLDVEFQELEITQARAALEAEKATSQAFSRAKMVQDFIRAGLPLDDALRLTGELLGPAGELLGPTSS
ncbi:hypothetical protein PTTG_02640 [Puccinia triticina 1-1 BBBD Race 1]|uniref:Uncharacterized protein n=1 Tax=Puccinia triticina (isolate 1-1 / race 1 (BBBD)) TaxID=630390 RepID=A0A180GDL9_PUCT1|nr:hypothetical protein PTTG_02640 [Puccinia triticina 1-1 BBBD Race 1]